MVWHVIVALLLSNATSGASDLKNPFTGSKKPDEHNAYPENLHCICSIYMLHYFKLNAIVFRNTLGVGMADKYDSAVTADAPLEALDRFDERLRSQGHIVWAMLDELREVAPNSKPPDDLMQVNLYLNNLTGSTRVSIENVPAKDRSYRFIKGYQYLFKKMAEALTKSMDDGQCKSENYTPAAGDDRGGEYGQTKLAAIKRLLVYPRVVDDLTQVRAILESNKRQMERLFQPTFDRENYMDFKPDYLLFNSLARTDLEYMNMMFSNEQPVNFMGNKRVMLNDSLLVSNVLTNYYPFGEKHKANIHDLLVWVRAVFHQDNVVAFQQHVMAAALSPVLVCLGNYFQIFDRLHPGRTIDINEDTSMYVKYEQTLRDLAQNLFGHLQTLVNLKLFPRTVQDYLVYISDKTAEVIDYSYDPYSPLISGVLDTVSKNIFSVMGLFKLKFSTNVDTAEGVELDFNKKSYVGKILEDFDDEIRNIGTYVASFEKYKYSFLRGLKVYSHNNMFGYPRFDILNTKQLGYKVVKNDLDNPPIIQLI
ncbi:uncharacterized protein LOC126835962 [Adelges cooleyi]|uniref:uncharacterized protein LOC126835962 n=1 Tax=Adelges cooleyi TaxID=133065 RepID=UPI00217F399C|nr:uncharacterized protein LOC126835962 [Adelges cooleyi]